MTTFAFPYFLENARDLELIGFALGLFFWIQMIRVCVACEPASIAKVAWLALLIATPGVGALIYFFVRVGRIRN